VPATIVLLLCLSRQPLRRRLRDAAVVAALTLLVMSPWLARNLALTGNPAAPAAQQLFYEEGQEYFDAQAMRQQIAFVRLVGFGRGLGDLLALPVNLTVRARANDYQAFGFRVGPLSVAGLLAALVLARARRAPALRALLTALLVLVLAWFFTSQEPRYLLPALGPAAVAAAVGWDEVLDAGARAWGPAGRRLAWLVPAAALAHTQAATLARLPYLYGYALGGLSVEGFRRQDPALAVADRLRSVLGPGDRLLAVYEPRGFFFQGLDYVFAHDFELMQLVHRAGDADTLAEELRRMGVTHVLVNTPNVARYRTVPVPGYGERELAGDLATLETLLRRHSLPLLAERGVVVRRMAWAGPAPGTPAEEATWER
ncbi:MAG TPA: hypothetical protein VFO85_17320, partial [Vicinamibacteria bacterium]|nr:hypothetical protein [Vicinamibacteria bacterium]